LLGFLAESILGWSRIYLLQTGFNSSIQFFCSLQVYWSRIFILPKKVIHLLEQKFNRFRWNGKYVKVKAKVSWDKVCAPKKEWGLGIKKLEVWNQASMLVHIWNLFARAGSIWVAWVENVWLRGKSIWQILIPHTSSWSWRKILKLRPIAKKFLSFKVGDGCKIFLWYDSWHPVGCLLGSYRSKVAYDAVPTIGPKLSSIIRHGECYWSNGRSDNLVEIQSRLHEVNLGSENVPIWNSRSGIFSCSETWERLRVNSLLWIGMA
jgi:hypothetical protein